MKTEALCEKPPNTMLKIVSPPKYAWVENAFYYNYRSWLNTLLVHDIFTSDNIKHINLQALRGIQDTLSALPSCYCLAGSHSSQHKQHSELTSIISVWLKWFAKTGCVLAVLLANFVFLQQNSFLLDEVIDGIKVTPLLTIKEKYKIHLTNRYIKIISIILALVFVHYTCINYIDQNQTELMFATKMNVKF